MTTKDIEVGSLTAAGEALDAALSEVRRPLSTGDLGEGVSGLSNWARTAGLLILGMGSLSVAGAVYWLKLCEGLPPGSLEPPTWSEFARLGMRMPVLSTFIAVPVGFTIAYSAKFRRIGGHFSRAIGHFTQWRPVLILPVAAILLVSVVWLLSAFVSVAPVASRGIIAWFDAAHIFEGPLRRDYPVEVRLYDHGNVVRTRLRTRYRNDYIFVDARGPHVVAANQVLGLRILEECSAQ